MHSRPNARMPTTSERAYVTPRWCVCCVRFCRVRWEIAFGTLWTQHFTQTKLLPHALPTCSRATFALRRRASKRVLTGIVASKITRITRTCRARNPNLDQLHGDSCQWTLYVPVSVVLHREQFQGSNGTIPPQNNGCIVPSVLVHSSNEASPKLSHSPAGAAGLWNCSLRRTTLGAKEA
jgi:hypothetical protein